MKKLFASLVLIFASHIALAVEVNDADLQGKWLIVKMGSMDVSDMKDSWQFRNGQWTAFSGKKALRPDPYKLKGNIIDLGHSKITILEFSKNSMKIKQRGGTYTLKKQ